MAGSAARPRHRHRHTRPGQSVDIKEFTFQLCNKDRILFAGHYLTSYRPGGAVVVYYSQDGGASYQVSPSTFPGADEASLTSSNSSHLVLNARMSAERCDVCRHGCTCRGRAFSTDGGLSWSQLETDPQLPDPICEGRYQLVVG